MPRSRKTRKSQNQVKPEWGKNNPQTKAKNKKIITVIAIIAVAAVALSAFVVLEQNVLLPPPSSSAYTIFSAPATVLTSPAGEYSSGGTRVLFMVKGTDSDGRVFNGNITIQMRDDKPITATNFVNLVNQGLYDGTLFHRVIAGFMIQGGQVTSQVVPSINDEIGSDNVNYNGTIAMANTGAANSANSQFFINVADNNNLNTSFDTSYTVFGQLVGGMDVVMKITGVHLTANPDNPSEISKPVQEVTLIKAIVLT
jgi:cyclophilin family peptidyl-prolyl cis-trans isomerase